MLWRMECLLFLVYIHAVIIRVLRWGYSCCGCWLFVRLGLSLYVVVTRTFLLVLFGFVRHVADERHELRGHARVGLKEVSDGCGGVF